MRTLDLKQFFARLTGKSWCLILLVSSLIGCANVQPYEREYLADPIMQLSEDAEEEAYEQHMHRALSQGLTGAPGAGGGCGCEQ